MTVELNKQKVEVLSRHNTPLDYHSQPALIEMLWNDFKSSHPDACIVSHSHAYSAVDEAATLSVVYKDAEA